jgi:hypothetical protein
MASLAEQDAAAKAKVSAFVQRSLVLLTDTPYGIRAEHPASGLLLRLRSGRVAVLTAAHTLPEEAPVNLHGAENKLYEDAVVGVAMHPTDDVGLGLVRRELQAHLAGFAMDLDQVECSNVRRIEQGARLLAAGFPSQFTQNIPIADDRVEHRFTALLKYTAMHNHDHRRLSIDWREGYPIDRAGPSPHKALDVPAGSPVYLKKPSGLSGGPVFRVSVATTVEGFDPKTHCRLVGIAVEFKDQRQLAVPWWVWSDWLMGF